MPQLKLFLLALSFYTRVPCPKNLDYTQLPQACVYLPLIGWLVGGVAAATYAVAELVWPQATAVIFALLSGVIMTGAFHEDGFTDVCDGFGGGYGKQRILEIMHDSQIGTYGALGLLILVLLKLSLLAALPSSALPAVLFAGHSISRLPPLLLMYAYVYARQEQSKGRAAIFKPVRTDLCFAASFAILPCLLLPKILLAAVLSIVLGNWLLGRYFYRHIGGYTGDCLGASQQLAELVYYLSISALWTFI